MDSNIAILNDEGFQGFSQWIQRCFTMAALLYIRLWNKPVHPDAIRMPLIMHIIFLLLCVALVGATIVVKFKTAKMALIFLSTGFVFYFLFMWEKALQRFDWYKRWANFANCKIFWNLQIEGIKTVRF